MLTDHENQLRKLDSGRSPALLKPLKDHIFTDKFVFRTQIASIPIPLFRFAQSKIIVWWESDH